MRFLSETDPTNQTSSAISRSPNVGRYEAVVRGVIGGGFLALAVSQRNLAWLGFSLITFYTAYTRRCAINSTFGINTAHDEERSRSKLRAVPTVH